MKDAYHVVPPKYDNEGFPVWSTPLTNSDITKRALILAMPDQVIPVIFVPGIMGSNLKLIKEVKENKMPAGDPAWRPDGAGLGNAVMSAASRQRILDPKNTVVDTRGSIGKKHYVTPAANMSLAAAESRGWGSVYWKSYGDVLIYLDSVLNAPCFYDPTTDKILTGGLFQELVDAGINVKEHAPLKLDLTEITHMSEYWFPVHAVGYNWLESNKDSGKYLANEIRRIKALYQQKLKRNDACKKVILITHSMGGLVARAAVHPDMGGAEADVLGILHGVMPAIGAAAAYKRMRTGFERGEINWFDLGSISGELGGQAVTGNNGSDVTAVLSHSPGGLQLLPNQVYQPEGWLKVAGVESQPYIIPTNGNPYKTIYLEKNKWWRLINPEWIDPAKKFDSTSQPFAAWSSYTLVLQTAETFFSTLGPHYHPNTYIFYGADTGHLSYGTVTWKKASFMYEGDISPLFNWHSTDVKLMKDGLASPEADDQTGHTGAKLNDDEINFEMTNATEPGDGTVPVISGSAPLRFAPERVHAQLALTGIDHQGAYSVSHETVMKFIAYSVCKISKDAT
jgi:hypothetical protein